MKVREKTMYCRPVMMMTLLLELLRGCHDTSLPDVTCASISYVEEMTVFSHWATIMSLIPRSVTPLVDTTSTSDIVQILSNL